MDNVCVNSCMKQAPIRLVNIPKITPDRVSVREKTGKYSVLQDSAYKKNPETLSVLVRYRMGELWATEARNIQLSTVYSYP